LNANDNVKSAILNLQFPFKLGKQNAYCSQLDHQLFAQNFRRHPVERVLPYDANFGAQNIRNILRTQDFGIFGPCGFLIRIYFPYRYSVIWWFFSSKLRAFPPSTTRIVFHILPAP
jgi:hypothetical protein